LHKLSKVKIRQAPPFKETFKEERLYVAQALMDGARLLAMFYTHPGTLSFPRNIGILSYFVV
jgi:hypothetical protein